MKGDTGWPQPCPHGSKARGTEPHLDLIRQVVEQIWNRGNLELADALFTPSYINHGGIIPDLVRGPEAIKSCVALYRTAFPGLHITVEILGRHEEMVEIHWTARNRSAEQHPDKAVPGQSLKGITRSRLVAGQIAESWTEWDRAGVLDHLGLTGRQTTTPRRTPVRGTHALG